MQLLVAFAQPAQARAGFVLRVHPPHLPNYQRGNWETIFVLKDNSRVTIHSLNEANGTTMLNAIKLRIDPRFLVGSYLSKSSLVVTDNQIAQINVKNRMAKYFSTGAKNELPDWIVKW